MATTPTMNVDLDLTITAKSRKPKPRIEGLKETWRCQNPKCGKVLAEFVALPEKALTKCGGCAEWNAIDKFIAKLA